MGMVALLPATLQPAIVSKPIMAFESGVVKITWALAPAVSATARSGAMQARVITLTLKLLIFVASWMIHVHSSTLPWRMIRLPAPRISIAVSLAIGEIAKCH